MTNKREICNKLTSRYATLLHQFDGYGETEYRTAKEVTESVEGGIRRYRVDPVFQHRVDSLVIRAIEVFEEEKIGVLPSLRPINCDQVAWILAAISRYLPKQEAPSVCRLKEMNGYALLYEIMEVAGLRFEDERAVQNGTPPDVGRMQFKSKIAAGNACEGALRKP